MDEARAFMEDNPDFELGEGKAEPPPFQEFTPEVKALLRLTNEMIGLRADVAGALGGGSKPKFERGPVHALERVQYLMDRQAHDDLVARLLPHKTKPKGPVD